MTATLFSNSFHYQCDVSECEHDLLWHCGPNPKDISVYYKMLKTKMLFFSQQPSVCPIRLHCSLVAPFLIQSWLYKKKPFLHDSGTVSMVTGCQITIHNTTNAFTNTQKSQNLTVSSQFFMRGTKFGSASVSDYPLRHKSARLCCKSEEESGIKNAAL